MEDLNFLIEKLQKEIERIEAKPEFEESGQIIKVGDGIVFISGLSKAFNSEMLFIEEKNIYLLALNLEEGIVGAVALNDFEKIKAGDIVKRTKKIIQVPVGNKLIGRIIDPLGRELDNLGPIETEDFYPLERKAPNVIEREPVKTPLHTGIKIIDALIPIGRGQRELILGDRQTGKTSIVLDTILNQKNDPLNTPVCVYVAIGQKMSKIRRFYEILKKEGALDYTIIVATTPEDLPILLYLAPYAGCSIGEYFRDQGKDVLVIYDDLTKHAWAWREVSLLLKRPAGREAYPGDIFYLHSRLLERSAKIKNGGSLTALPICETQLGDISSYIPTNLISITDGQIYLETDLFKANFRPAINIGLSVSRVGSKAQTKIMKKVAGKLKLDLAQFRELEEFTKLSAELPPEIAQKIKRGRILTEVLKQENLKPLTFEKIAILIYSANNGFFDEIELNEIKKVESKLLNYFETEKKDILEEINQKQDLTQDLENKIKESLIYFFQKNK
jgi:F-type H+-transporting ATPase subunit alpha